MKRIIVGALLSALAVSPLITTSDVAHAAPKKGKAPAAQKAAPQSAEIAKTMGDLKWGTSREEAYTFFENKIKEKYKPQLAKARNAMEEDKIRAKQKDELSALKSSVVDFNGRNAKTNGWDVSFLKTEYTHNNNESMFVVKDENSKNFYFFIQNKLWKWYKSFDEAAFEGKSFDQFAAAIQARFGASQKRESTEGREKLAWLEWQDATTRLRAIDNKDYGAYSLVFDDKNTLSKLAQLRPNKPKESKSGNSLVDSVTSDEANNSASDTNPDAIDRITGKIRNRQDAPAPTGGSKKGDDKGSAPPPPPPPSGGVTTEDDPLKGLGL